MRNIVLHQANGHRFILLNESETGEEEGIRSNQYLIVHNGAGVLLDPGGFGVMPRVLVEMLRYVQPEQVAGIVLSHQDPDIVGGLSSWLELMDVPVYISRIWLRFLPHYGLPRVGKFVGVPDDGMALDVAPGFLLNVVPAHFLHSEGQINVFDPLSRILFSGDIGAAVMPESDHEPYVDDFAEHLPHIDWFHRRYMCSNRAARVWVRQARQLAPLLIAPQHGPVYRGQAVSDFLDWFEQLECGVDLFQPDGSLNLRG